MSVFEALAIFLAGLAAGTINTIVGSGTLITFPTLLFFGYPPLTANMSQQHRPGRRRRDRQSYGYRHELGGAAPDAPAARADVPRSARVIGAVAAARAAARGVPGDRAGADRDRAGARRRSVRGCSAGRPRGARRTRSPGQRRGTRRALRRRRLRRRGLRRVLRRGAGRHPHGHPQRPQSANRCSASTATRTCSRSIVNTRGRARLRPRRPRARSTGWSSCSSRSGRSLGGVVGRPVGRRLPPTVLRGLIVVIGVVGIIKIVWFS